MEDAALARLEAAAKARAYRRRSDMYRWLRARYAKVNALLEEFEPPWHVIAAEMAADGVPGGTGGPPTARGARRVWECVCRDVAEERRRQLTGIKSTRQQPSRAPVTWQPPVARSSSEAHPISAGQTTTSAPPRASQNPSAPGEEDSFDRAFRRLAERSGR